MDAERARALMLGLPHVVETQQWGDNLVFWVGDKAIGGKMLCLLNLDARDRAADGGEHGVVSFAAGAERFADLVDRAGLVPAPYFARIFWVAAERWGALRNGEWEDVLTAAHGMTLEKLPKKVREVLAMSELARGKLIAERRQQLARKAAAKKRAGS
jgi:predicted DNA-binding protein (MmcQ/YjbR family)